MQINTGAKEKRQRRRKCDLNDCVLVRLRKLSIELKFGQGQLRDNSDKILIKPSNSYPVKRHEIIQWWLVASHSSYEFLSEPLTLHSFRSPHLMTYPSNGLFMLKPDGDH